MGLDSNSAFVNSNSSLKILDVLFDSEFFVPENIGIPSLAPVAKMPYDHFLHEFSSVEIVKDGIISMSSIELIRRIETANKRGWFYGIY